MTTWKGNPQLQPMLYPIEHLVADPDNANEHNVRSIEGIKRSYEAYGQQKPIIINKARKVLAGNGQLRAATEMGWTHIAIAVFDNDNEMLQRAYAIADNRSAEHSTWNDRLGEQLDELQSLGFHVEDMGFNNAEVEALSSGWNVEGWDIGAIDDHVEDGKHGLIKVLKVDSDASEHVRATVEAALRDAGYAYEVKTK